MKARWAWCGLAGLGVLLIACGSGPSSRQSFQPFHYDYDLQVPSRLEKHYPGVFHTPPGGPVGVGFSPLGAFSSDSSYVRAARMACRLLAWSIHVRVRGEKLAGASFGPGGERIELLETPALSVEQCRLDTLALDGHGWITATAGTATATFGKAASFGEQTPSWTTQNPQQKGWHYGRGVAEVSYVDEPGSWELATYWALLDLAFSFARIGVRREEKDGWFADAFIVETDIALQGMRLLYRWRDRQRLYVLVGIPRQGITFYLGGDGSP